MQVLLFDVAGRRLLGPEPLVLPGLGLRWSTEGLGTGAYFLRLDDARGRTCGVQRLTVVR
jgi:hypothetical protein